MVGRPGQHDGFGGLIKKVVIYGINYAPEVAGVGRYSGEIGADLVARGHTVSVVTAPPHYPSWRVDAPHSAGRWSMETVDGARVYRCPLYLHGEMSGVWRLLAPVTFALSSAPVAFWRILTTRPDIVIAVEPTLLVAPVALLAAALVGAKTVLHVQDLEVDAAFAVGHMSRGGIAARLASAFERFVMKRFDRVITIANAMARRVIDKGVAADRVAVVRNWVDLDQIQPLTAPSSYRADLGLAEDAFVVLYAGSLGAKHSLGLLVTAARALKDRSDIVFVIAGEGPMKPELEAAARELTNLRVLGFQPEARFSDFLGLADVHVLPQERDAADLLLPSKLGGMLASGRQILLTADTESELGEFLGETCLFVPPGEPAPLIEAITRLSGTPVCPVARGERLALAQRLSKAVLIRQFCETAGLADGPGRR